MSEQEYEIQKIKNEKADIAVVVSFFHTCFEGEIDDMIPKARLVTKSQLSWLKNFNGVVKSLSDDPMANSINTAPETYPPCKIEYVGEIWFAAY